MFGAFGHPLRTVRLRLVGPGGIDRPAGKTKRVVDLRH
jgi:hypothetical protein